jgi:hypothetical protein
MRGGQSCSRESWKTTLEIQGPSRKTGIMLAKRTLTLLFLVVRRREMRLKMKVMMMK